MPQPQRFIPRSLAACALAIVAFLVLAPGAGAADEPVEEGNGPVEECTDHPELEHHFDPADASGWVRHAGELPLCDPVYIHPTTWTFVNTAEGESIWPQDLLGTETLAVPVDGTSIAFAAPGPLECAQADIYYTGTRSDPGLADRLLSPGHPNEPPQLYWESNGPRPTWAVYGGTTGENGVLTQDCGDDEGEEPVVEASAALSYECGPDVLVNLSAEGGPVDFVVTADGEVVASPTVDGSQEIIVELDTEVRIIVEGPVGEVLIDEVVVFEPCVLGEEETPPVEEEPVVDEEEGEIAGIGEEAPAGQEAAAGQQAAPTTLPRTGGPAVVYGLIAALALGLGTGLRTLSRRLV